MGFYVTMSYLPSPLVWQDSNSKLSHSKGISWNLFSDFQLLLIAELVDESHICILSSWVKQKGKFKYKFWDSSLRKYFFFQNPSRISSCSGSIELSSLTPQNNTEVFSLGSSCPIPILLQNGQYTQVRNNAYECYYFTQWFPFFKGWVFSSSVCFWSFSSMNK